LSIVRKELIDLFRVVVNWVQADILKETVNNFTNAVCIFSTVEVLERIP